MLKVICGIYKTKKMNSCPLCGAVDFEKYFQKKEYGVVIDLVLCTSCNFVFQKEQLDESSLMRFYDSEYRRIKSSPVTEKHFEKRKRRGSEILEFLIKNNVFCSRMDVLEIGSAQGGILSVFKDVGNDVYGIEWDKACTSFANNKSITTYPEMSAIEEKKFDLIILSHLLEHISDPFKFLNDLKKYMHKDSLLFILAPGLQSNDINRNAQVGHLWYFDNNSLNNLLEKSAFELVSADKKIKALYRSV